jgi:hypothetical protein
MGLIKKKATSKYYLDNTNITLGLGPLKVPFSPANPPCARSFSILNFDAMVGQKCSSE